MSPAIVRAEGHAVGHAAVAQQAHGHRIRRSAAVIQPPDLSYGYLRGIFAAGARFVVGEDGLRRSPCRDGALRPCGGGGIPLHGGLCDLVAHAGGQALGRHALVMPQGKGCHARLESQVTIGPVHLRRLDAGAGLADEGNRERKRPIRLTLTAGHLLADREASLLDIGKVV